MGFFIFGQMDFSFLVTALSLAKAFAFKYKYKQYLHLPCFAKTLLFSASSKQMWSSLLSDRSFLSNSIISLSSDGTCTHETSSLIGADASVRFDFHGDLVVASSACVMSESTSLRRNFL